MKNPYEHDWLEDEVRLGRKTSGIATAGFLIFLLLPALSLLFPRYRPESVRKDLPDLKARLVSLEDLAKKLPLLEQWRKQDQVLATALFGEGNGKVHVGREGWLYYRPDLESIFGKGPYHVEPASVAREKAERSWQAPVPVIKDFAAQLAKRNISLIFVPVPTKPMVCREGLGMTPGLAPPSAWEDVARDLSGAGIEFVDLLPLFTSRGSDEARFLKQDTHWTPETMEAVAHEVASRIASSRGSDRVPNRVESVRRSHRGDLVGMLDLGERGAVLFPEESVTLRRFLDPATGRPIGNDPNSNVVLLGDSFVNLYEDPELGFGEPGESMIGAGFASHFAHALGHAAEVFAINGGGATAVRETFASLSPERLANVDTVVWVISARDLLLPELPARRAGIEWRTVEIGRGAAPTAPPAAVELTLTLRERSPIDDPALTPYASAVYSTLFEAEDGSERLVFFWAFRDRKLDPAASLEPGRRYRLRLASLDSDAAANRATRLDDLFRPDLTPWFATSFQEVD